MQRFLWRHPKAKLAALLAAPLTWLTIAYLGSLASLLLYALYRTDSFTFEVVKHASTDNLHRVYTTSVYRTVTIRTVGVALAVTGIDLLIAFPMAFTMAKLMSPRARTVMAVAVVTPLWASYLVKAYAWRSMLDPQGGVLRKWLHLTPGYSIGGTIVTLSYLWLPYMILPIYAGLERLPGTLLEAASDLGARSWRTFHSVVLPLLVPAIVAGTIFTFSLSLGDYITVGLVGGTTQMIGNVVARDFGAPDVPLAAAFATVPIVIMIAYLLAARRTGAFENL